MREIFSILVLFMMSELAIGHDGLQTDCHVASVALMRAREIAIANGNNDQTLTSFIGLSPKIYFVTENDQNYPQLPAGSYVISVKRENALTDPVRKIVFLKQENAAKFKVTEYEGESERAMKAIRTYESATPPIGKSLIAQRKVEQKRRNDSVEYFIGEFEKLFATTFNRKMFTTGQGENGPLEVEDAFALTRTSQILEMPNLSSLVLPFAKSIGKAQAMLALKKGIVSDATVATDDQFRFIIVVDSLRDAREKYQLKDAADRVADLLTTQIFN